MKAMILAAGLGTRLQPLTNTKPKVLVEVGGYTMLELTIHYLKKYGIEELIINVHHFPDQIIEYLKKNKGFGLKYTISDERNLLMDTGGAITFARKHLEGNEPFILMGADILTTHNLEAVIRHHKINSPLVTLAVKDRNTSRSLLFDKKMHLVGWRDNSNGMIKGLNADTFIHALGFSVIHVIDPKIFSLIEEKGPFSIIDLYLRLMESQKIIGYREDDAIWIEFGRAERMADIIESKEFKSVINTI
jgi:NDP-sugar pyrophosphorylase family protein